ncbi:hypothetical protein LNV23_06220 [Paucibacter sp. DJ1R-11]|uniref:hypothetical protein n=1 Tax=Paucibacter sp. DJ1R-11 TaxID=2893556 RepID=UPI0021E37CA8|nr:hypothetical protein [Paucibacter sp. DJ1R-11]MCV2363049.1 hypothetical protein [Paucibacter sp. DJ1R-11]
MADLSTLLILLALLLALLGALRLDLLRLAFKNLLDTLTPKQHSILGDSGLKVSARSETHRQAQTPAQKPAFHRSGRRH